MADSGWIDRPDLDGVPTDHDHGLFRLDGAEIERSRSRQVEGVDIHQGSLRHSVTQQGNHQWRHQIFGTVVVPGPLPKLSVHRRRRHAFAKGRNQPFPVERFDEEMRVVVRDADEASTVARLLPPPARAWLAEYAADHAVTTWFGGHHISIEVDAGVLGNDEKADDVARLIWSFHGVVADLLRVGAAPAEGRWAPDPHRRHELRWWDGSAWTEHVSDGGVASVDPA